MKKWVSVVVPGRLMIAAVGAVLLASLVSSVAPLVGRAQAAEFGCYDLECTTHQVCKMNNCDVCHTDDRCALVPPDPGGD